MSSTLQCKDGARLGKAESAEVPTLAARGAARMGHQLLWRAHVSQNRRDVGHHPVCRASPCGGGKRFYNWRSRCFGGGVGGRGWVELRLRVRRRRLASGWGNIRRLVLRN